VSSHSLSVAGKRWSLSGWIRERVRRRRAPTHLPYVLEHRTIFVVPSMFGLAYAVLLLVMALGGLNFNNNLALLVVFTLAAIAQSTTLITYRNLRGLQVGAIRAEAVFAGTMASFQLRIDNPESRDRYTVLAAPSGGTASDCVDIPGGGSAGVMIHVPTRHRGWLACPSVRVETRYPLGLFRAWTWLFPEARMLVYPAPAGNPPPLPMASGGQQGQPRRGEGEQIHGLREYREGDSLRSVAWRTSARHEHLYTREMETPRERSCVLSWRALEGRDTEQRLAILSAWVMMAESRQLAYRLDIPGGQFGPARGPQHRHECLERLALFGK
jgi:uncharacterized protein (DUF58 family)